MVAGAILIAGNPMVVRAEDVNKKVVDEAVNELNKKENGKLDENQQKALKDMVTEILRTEETVRKMAEPYFRVKIQNPGDKIAVAYVNFNKNTFMVIKDIVPDGSENILGVSKFLSAGKNENIEIQLTKRVIGTTLTAYLFIDNGDGVFNESTDLLAKDPRNDLKLFQFVDIRTRVMEN
jgi:hypothetical protein